MRIAIGIAVVVFITITCADVSAQGTAQIHGTIRDASGAAVPGAEVKVTQTDTGVSRSVASGSDGSFVVTNLATGPYQIEASKEGFSKVVQTGIVLQVNSDPLVEIALKVGTVNEQVSVEANASQVETRNSAVGTVIDNQRILELPLNGRNVTDLISLAGAAVQIAVASRGKGTSLYPTPMFQVAGGLGYATAYSLDGADFMNPSSGGAYTLPFPDALQEFRVDTSGSGAMEGRASAVSAVTKSGTNQFHGDAFEFLRNDLVNAHQYFATSRSTQMRNQFGGTLGGAIKKDKLFFFGAFQETTVRQDPANLEAWIPTPAVLNGDWTAMTSAACNNGRAITMKTPPGFAGSGFVGNKIDPAQYSKTGLGIMLLTLAQIPQQPDACGHILYGQLTKLNEYQGVGRMDYQLSDKHTLFARYQNVITEQPVPYSLPPVNALNATVSGQDNLLQDLALGFTYVFGPATVNAFRISGNWFRIRQTGVDTVSTCDGQIAQNIPVTYYCGNVPHRTNLIVSGGTGGFTIGPGQAPASATNNVLVAISDDVSLIRGVHQMSFGITASESRNTSNYRPTLDTNKLTLNSNITGEGLGDLLTGQLSSMVYTNQSHLDIASISTGLYFTDTWKVKPRLTAIASVRWDPFFPQRLKHSGIANFDFARFNAGTHYPGDPGTPGWAGAFNKPWHFAPRLGLAWDVTGDGRTSVRSSFGYAFVPVTNYWRQDPEDKNPWTNGTSLQSPVGGLNNPWLGYTYINPVTGATAVGNPFPTINGNGFTQQGQYTSTPYNLTVPQTASWNLSIQ